MSDQNLISLFPLQIYRLHQESWLLQVLLWFYKRFCSILYSFQPLSVIDGDPLLHRRLRSKQRRLQEKLFLPLTVHFFHGYKSAHSSDSSYRNEFQHLLLFHKALWTLLWIPGCFNAQLASSAIVAPFVHFYKSDCGVFYLICFRIPRSKQVSFCSLFQATSL